MAYPGLDANGNCSGKKEFLSPRISLGTMNHFARQRTDCAAKKPDINNASELKFDNPLVGDEIVISVLGTTLMFECLEGNLKTSIILVSVLLASCAAPPNAHYAHWNSSTVSLESATAKCDDESSAALQAIDLSYQGMFDQSLDEAFRKGDHLMAKCMKAQGYILQI